MSADDREQQFERALTRLLRDASPKSHCPDAETLSAYQERTLSTEEMTVCKEHIAGCVLCQEILALVEQSENVPLEEARKHEIPVARAEELEMAAAAAPRPQVLSRAPQAASAKAARPAAFRKSKPRAAWRWLVPVGALAACAILAVGIREFQVKRQNVPASVQMAKNNPAPATQPSLSFPPAAPEKSKDQVKREESPAEAQTPAPAQTLRQPLRDQKVARPSSQLSTQGEEPKLLGGALSSAPPDTAALSQKQAGKRYASTEIERQQELDKLADAARSRDLQTPAAVPPPQAPTAGMAANAPAPEPRRKATVPSMSETVEVQAQAPPANTSSSELSARGRVVTNLLNIAAVEPHYIVAPSTKFAWRVGDAGKIERSTDSGITWQLENSGVTADLTTGSATSDKVCWVVGKHGTILLTTDGGKHWKQISSPISGDLGGIHASDAAHASIWDVPNRASFETGDGGATWTPAANE